MNPFTAALITSLGLSPMKIKAPTLETPSTNRVLPVSKIRSFSFQLKKKKVFKPSNYLKMI